MVERIHKDDLALLLLQTLLLFDHRIRVNETTEEFLRDNGVCILLGAHSISEAFIFVHKIIQEVLIIVGEDTVRAEIAAGFIFNASGHHEAVHALLLIRKPSLTVVT